MIAFLLIYFSLHIAEILSEINRINGHLRIASFYNPLGHLKNSPPNSKGLIESKLIEMMAQSLNFTYDIYVPTDVLQFGIRNPKTGNWSGVLGQVIRGEVDMTISFGPVDAIRFAVTDASVGIIIDNVILMIPAPTEAVDSTGIVSVYSGWTWFLIVLSAVAIGTVLRVTALLQSEQIGLKESLVDPGAMTMMIISSIFAQGANISHLKSLSLKLILTSWLLPLVVLVYAYSGTLISKLTAPTYQFMVNSVDEVADNIKIKLYVVKDSSAQEAFTTSPLKSFQEIAKRWEKYSDELLLADSNSIVNMVATNRYHGYIGGDVNAIFNMEKDRKKTGKCRCTILPDKLVSRNNGLFLQKSSPLTKIIDHQLLIFNQAGFGRYLEKTYASSRSACAIDALTRRSSKPTKLTLTQLAVPFVFLAVGWFAAFLLFTFEICCHHRFKKNQNPKKRVTRLIVVKTKPVEQE